QSACRGGGEELPACVFLWYIQRRKSRLFPHPQIFSKPQLHLNKSLILHPHLLLPDHRPSCQPGSVQILLPELHCRDLMVAISRIVIDPFCGAAAGGVDSYLAVSFCGAAASSGLLYVFKDMEELVYIFFFGFALYCMNF